MMSLMSFTWLDYVFKVGLRLLFSNILVQTALCLIGLVLPLCTTLKAILLKVPDEQHKCLVYWAVYGSFTVAEMIADKLINWFPLYFYMKLAFLVWLQLPSTNADAAVVHQQQVHAYKENMEMVMFMVADMLSKLAFA